MMQIDFGSIVALALLVAIVGLAFTGRRHGRHGFGVVDRALVQEHGRLKDRMAAVEAQMGGCATKSDIAALNGKIDALEESAASSGDIHALEGKVNVALSEIAAVAKAADRTEAGVQRIESFFIQKGMER